MIRITFWNGLGFIFFTFIKTYVVIYFFGGSGIDLGIIMALQPLARLFSMPLIAYLTDRTSKKRLVLIGSIGRTFAYILYWLSLVVNNLFMFGAGTFIQGLLVGFFWPPFFSLISEKNSSESDDISPIVQELSGIIHLEDDIDYKIEYHNYIQEKYS